MPELSLDHHERDALVGHLDRVSVAELVRSEPAPHAGGSGGVLELLASSGSPPVSPATRMTATISSIVGGSAGYRMPLLRGGRPWW